MSIEQDIPAQNQSEDKESSSSPPESSSFEKEGVQAQTSLDDNALNENGKYTIDIRGKSRVVNTGDHATFNLGSDAESIASAVANKMKDMLPQDLLRHGEEEQAQNDRGSKFRTQINLQILEPPLENKAATESAKSVESMPQTKEKFAEWYRDLHPYTQCYIQALAVFSGGSITAIAAATNTLYQPVVKANMQAAKLASAPTILPSYMLTAPDNLSLDERLACIYAEIKRTESRPCIYWQDIKNNISSFQMRLLQFLATNSPHWPQSIFLEQLLAWSELLHDGYEQWALRALGVISWYTPERLEELTNKWFQVNKWERAAYLLFGAYEIDFFLCEDKNYDLHDSPVFPILRHWVRRGRRNEDNARGCAAALTYLLIGRDNVQVAIEGLDSLLLPHRREREDEEYVGGLSEDIFTAVLECYRELTIMGYLREVLAHCAKRLEESSYYGRKVTNKSAIERSLLRRQRLLTVVASVSAFYYIVGTSLAHLPDHNWTQYKLDDVLPDALALQHRNGQEPLLLGLLIEKEQKWRANICSILCSALIEKLEDSRALTFAILSSWADQVLKDQGPYPARVRQAYILFIVELHRTLQRWCQHWQELGIPASATLQDFMRRLERWQKQTSEKQVTLKDLAEEILTELSIDTFFVAKGVAEDV